MFACHPGGACHPGESRGPCSSWLARGTALLALTLAYAGNARAQGTDSVRALPSPIHLCAGGDVTLGTDLDAAWVSAGAKALQKTYGISPVPADLIASLRPLFQGADVILVNSEESIGSGPVAKPKCSAKATNCFAFRAPTSAAAAIRSLGDSTVRVVANVANNHAHDAGLAGFVATRAALTDAGVLVTGADTLATPVVLANGDTIAVLGFHTSSDVPDARNLAAVKRHVARAVAQYQTVIVTMHLGAEGAPAQRTRDQTEMFVNENRGNPVAFANAAIGAGATMVIGHGPHVLRAEEWRGDRLVAYSMGNLLTFGPFSLHEPANRGAVLCATIVAPGVVSAAELRPTMQIAPGGLFPDSTNRAWTLVDSLTALDFPRTGVLVAPNGMLGRRDSLVGRGGGLRAKPR